MELSIFLRLLARKWWIIAIMLFVTLGSTYLFSESQTPIYSSATTFVVSPSSEDLNETGFLSGLSVLGGQPTVVNTYANIAASAYVKQKAGEALGLTQAQTKKLIVLSRVVTGTNVIEISVEGADPLLVQALTVKIGESTINYIQHLNGVYNLKLLDDAMTPEAPIRPNKKLNLVLGAALGLVLGVGIAFLTGLNKF